MFPAKDDLLQNMMGLLGNVAEVPQLRPKLMTKNFMEEVANLLEPRQEVSHNAGEMLAHLASDGAAVWTIKEPSREDVLERLGLAISRWDSKWEKYCSRLLQDGGFALMEDLLRQNCEEVRNWAGLMKDNLLHSQQQSGHSVIFDQC